MVVCAGILAVWRPWSEPPELEPGTEVSHSPAQQAAIAASQILSQRLPLAPARERPTLLVNPLRPPRSDTELAHLGDALAAELIAQLSRVPGLTTLGSDTTFALAMRSDSAAIAGEPIPFKYRLDTEIDGGAGQLRLLARLSDSAEGKILWEERTERPASEFGALVAGLHSRVIRSLNLAPAKGEAPVAGPLEPQALLALDLTFKAQHLQRHSARPDLLQARRLLEEAVSVSPSALPAHLALYTLLTGSGFSGGSPFANEPAENLLAIATRAVTLAPSDPMARAAYADSLTLVGQHGTAVAQIDASVGKTLVGSEVLRIAARVMERSGEFDKALALMQRALQIDPLINPSTLAFPLANSLYQLGRYQEAADQAGRCLQREPAMAVCLLTRAAALAQTGASMQAQQLAETLRRQVPEASISSLLKPLSAGTKNPEDLRHLGEGLRKAGLPE